jgi:2-dehydro-3-deoxygluconokinase
VCKIICFGEIMLRLNPTENLRFIQADKFHASYAGSEASVAVSLTNYGLDSAFISNIPNNEIGQAAINSLRKFGVDTSLINRIGDRLGIYFVEKGVSQRPSKVVYDRKFSAIAMASNSDFNWKEILQGAEWFHFSGITPALGDNVADICLEACKQAKKYNIKVSCDLNYRNKLWSSEKAKIVMTKLMKYVDIIIGNEEDAEKIFDIKAENTNENFSNLDIDSYKSVAQKLKDKFDFELVALTLRESISADRNLWSGLLYDGKEYCLSNKYDINIVDRLGAGDSFAAGLIYSLVSGYKSEKIINFAVAASCLKHTIEYDFNLSSVHEVESLIEGNTSGRVQR